MRRFMSMVGGILLVLSALGRKSKTGLLRKTLIFVVGQRYRPESNALSNRRIDAGRTVSSFDHSLFLPDSAIDHCAGRTSSRGLLAWGSRHHCGEPDLDHSD